jgi:hypothetical protein
MGFYYMFWAMLITASLWVSLGAFVWAYRHSQFRDQDRARFLALRGEPPASPSERKSARRLTLVTCAILALGFAAICTALVIAALKTPGGTV